MRFPGFEEEWEVKKLGDVATIKSDKYNPLKATTSIKCIELEHLMTETGQLLGYIDGSRLGSIKNIFNKGDVLFGKLRPYLKKYLYAPFDGVCSSEIWVLKSINISSEFLYQIVQTNSFIDLANQSSGSKMPRADWNVVENGLFSFPSLQEQRKIASFISLIDERIVSQKKIINNLESLMDGFREKIFSQKLRFKDEDGNDFPEWESKSLGEIGEIITGKTPSTKNLDLWNGEIQFVTPTDIIGGKYQLFTNRTIKKTEKLKVLPKKSIMFTCIASIGKMSLSLNPSVTNQQINSVIPYKNCNNEFLYYAILNITGYIKSTPSSSTLPIINKTEFSKFKISFPAIQEQIEISNFLSSIDEKIEIEKKILAQYEIQKKHLLSNLFI